MGKLATKYSGLYWNALSLVHNNNSMGTTAVTKTHFRLRTNGTLSAIVDFAVFDGDSTSTEAGDFATVRLALKYPPSSGEVLFPTLPTHPLTMQ